MAGPPIIEDPDPVQTGYIPESFIDRDEEQDRLKALFTDEAGTGAGNLLIYGPRGTGKTHLVRSQMEDAPDTVNTGYIPCYRHDTQYKVLKQVVSQLTDKEVADGHHSAALKREVESRVEVLDIVVILDEIDFLLLNDGEDLLYYLSRTDGVNVVLISSNYSELESQVDERTLSSLRLEQLRFEPYTAEEVYQILEDCVEKAFSPRSVRQEALTYIASTTSNPGIGLYWLLAAAGEATDAVTEVVVDRTESKAYDNYAMSLLDRFTDHHGLIYQAIKELTREAMPPFQTGQIYNRYQDICESYGVEALSHRRISDFLKHFELLDLIEVDYHYGGQKGKTREVRLKRTG